MDSGIQEFFRDLRRRGTPGQNIDLYVRSHCRADVGNAEGRGCRTCLYCTIDGTGEFCGHRHLVVLATESLCDGRFDDELVVRCEPVHCSLRYIADVLV